MENKNFQGFPVSFADLKNLKKVNFQNTSIPEFPYECQFWGGLVELIMKENTQMEKLPGTHPPSSFSPPGSH